MLGRIGDDEFGREMRDNLVKVGCDVSGIRSVPGASGVALIFVADDGQNSIIVVPGANDAFAPEHITQMARKFAALKLYCYSSKIRCQLCWPPR